MPESVSEKMEHIFARVYETEPVVHAYAHIDEESVRVAAEEADANGSTGPLHGQAFAVKEVIEVVGIATAGGSKVLKDHVPKEDATVVRRLYDAGALLIGTQVSHELTCGLDQPATRNPWNIECYPGGSSAGAGVSVAIGSANFALGTDAAGSVRIPAAMTGTVGMKATAGLISKQGVLRQASAPSIDNVGIVASRVAELAHVLDVISGPDPDDANSLHQIAENAFDEQLGTSVLKGLRVAILGEKTRALLDETWIMDKEIDNAFISACDQLKDAGAELVTIELPSLAYAIPTIVTFFSTELAAAHRYLIYERAADYHPEVLSMLKQAIDTPASAVSDAVQLRARLSKEVLAAFNAANVEYLVTPTTPRVAMPLSTFDPTQELGSLIPYTCGFNLTGQPAISVPCGFTADGLPIGLQLVGLHYKDTNVLQVANAYEQMNTWCERKPTINFSQDSSQLNLS